MVLLLVEELVCMFPLSLTVRGNSSADGIQGQLLQE